MKIDSSSIVMTGAHEERFYAHKETMTLEAAKSQNAVDAILSLSSENTKKSYKESMTEYKEMQKEEAEKRRRENEADFLKDMAERMRTQRTERPYYVSDEADAKIKMLRKILAILRGEKVTELREEHPQPKQGVLDLRSAELRYAQELSVKAEAVTSNRTKGISIGTNATGTTWQKITATSGFAVEMESTTFASTGVVKTADGRRIDFGIEVSMSRAFMSEINMLDVSDYIKTDPLIINLDTNIASLSDQKFLFDLDSDGEKEEISFAQKGSGFLALDKNNDGSINDGSELFGTKSGDGFRDLAAYDEDGNGWIDENDDVFSKLKVWTKDENGNDVLLDLKSADVGAIYLGNIDTQFSLKNDENKLNGEIKKTGIYLKESSGAAGTINHVDLAI